VTGETLEHSPNKSSPLFIAAEAFVQAEQNLRIIGIHAGLGSVWLDQGRLGSPELSCLRRNLIRCLSPNADLDAAEAALCTAERAILGPLVLQHGGDITL